ncbi:Regulator of RNase E activity RraA [Dietzia kunjamensis subsp. schimae]|uniref:Putative 4-hydroxy-4-methyl-2-oxoglutarate aldolase n=1 Tax=Dietzia kunjamensis subsp. schimae TaxID=498198 RepID=A0ABY1MXS8_9ACTN|nr:RraA family protein [Dietzia kunjamensis]SMO47286.1 Regulator of RNase E activity RraA [Dietzia kunjamensis subsp. schimae]
MTDPHDRLTGRLDDSLFATLTRPQLDPTLLDRLRKVPDTSSAVADALDELGVGGCVPSTRLRPLLPDHAVVGQCVTLRYRRLDGDVSTNRGAGRGRVFGDRDLYGLAQPGDVAVMDCGGSTDAAVVGALSAKWARKAGVAACLVDGPVRDSASIQGEGLPVWSTGTIPQAARYRLDVAELNGPVTLSGVPVHPGDVVVADRDGVAVIPFAAAEAAVSFCERAHHEEQELVALIEDADSLEDLIAQTSGGHTPT